MQHTGIGYWTTTHSKLNHKYLQLTNVQNMTTRSGRTLNTCNQYWLLHDNNHYHSINNIKGFLAVDYFCPHCFQGFTNKKAFDNHKCEQCEEGVCNKKKKKQVKSSRIGKDIAHYLNRQDMKGGKDEVVGKTSS